nr:MAG TPA: hypothetical protein [Caudoviricetes sp.]
MNLRTTCSGHCNRMCWQRTRLSAFIILISSIGEGNLSYWLLIYLDILIKFNSI